MGVNRKQRHLEFPFWREYWLKFNFNYFSWTKDQNLFCRELFSWGWTEKFNKRLTQKRTHNRHYIFAFFVLVPIIKMWLMQVLYQCYISFLSPHRNRTNVYPSQRYAGYYPSMKRNTRDQFSMKNCRLPTNINTWKHPVHENTIPSFTRRQNFSNFENNKIIQIDFVRVDDQTYQ
jgi:hypothetical protein